MKNLIGTEDVEEFLEENGIDMMSAMAEVLKTQYQIALGLTQLVVEHCGEEKVNKDYVFNVFKEASKFINTEMNKEF